MNHLGQHILVEFYNCDKDIIDSEVKISELLTQSAKISNATIIKTTIHKFAPQGVSGVIVIAESHFAIHTWPEFNYVSLDIFSCGNNIDTSKAIEFLKKEFNSTKSEIKHIVRGDVSKILKESQKY